MIQLVEEAVQAYQDRQLLEAINTAYAALREDPIAWAELLEERSEWDVTLGDGLEEE
ncbi:MAG TPA: toxin-antitoxin system protein [Promineifilum sp.]|nr:toxin-antitoxin system protein [Promineifilum sp.]